DIASAPRRDRIKATDRIELTAKSDNISARVATSEPRRGAPRSPAVTVKSDSQNPMTTSPCPEESSSTLMASAPISLEKLCAGDAEFDEAPIKTGLGLPKLAQILRSRVSTTATWDPKTPRQVCASSTMTYLRLRKNVAQPV